MKQHYELGRVEGVTALGLTAETGGEKEIGISLAIELASSLGCCVLTGGVAIDEGKLSLVGELQSGVTPGETSTVSGCWGVTKLKCSVIVSSSSNCGASSFTSFEGKSSGQYKHNQRT